jgi:formylglycine-generating enzyme required for sulfatase activity
LKSRSKNSQSSSARTASQSKYSAPSESVKQKKTKKKGNIVDIDVEQLELDNKSPFDRHQIGDSWIEPVTGMVFAWVPGGTFRMGSGKWDAGGKHDELPEHTVDIDGFWMGKFLVTQENWNKVMANSFWKKVRIYDYNPSWFKLGQAHPVEQVSWNETIEFIQKLVSLNKDKYYFRLPTEAEWEYAARSCGKHHKYAGGKNLDAIAWYSANSGMTSQPVGKKLPNQIGIYDMSGNVYEWCLDEYSESAYKQHQKNNPLIFGKGPKRVIRGGSWSNSPHEMRSTYRASVNQDFKGNYIGFRLVMTSVTRKKFNE